MYELTIMYIYIYREIYNREIIRERESQGKPEYLIYYVLNKKKKMIKSCESKGVKNIEKRVVEVVWYFVGVLLFLLK